MNMLHGRATPLRTASRRLRKLLDTNQTRPLHSEWLEALEALEESPVWVLTEAQDEGTARLEHVYYETIRLLYRLLPRLRGGLDWDPVRAELTGYLDELERLGGTA